MGGSTCCSDLSRVLMTSRIRDICALWVDSQLMSLHLKSEWNDLVKTQKASQRFCTIIIGGSYICFLGAWAQDAL